MAELDETFPKEEKVEKVEQESPKEVRKVAKKKQAKKGNGKRNPEVSAEAFVAGWKKGGTAREVAARIGCSMNTLRRRATRLRQRGVKLPKLKESRGDWHKVDVKALNKQLGAK